MKKFLIFLLVLILFSDFYNVVLSQDLKTTTTEKELIRINVRNDFDKVIQVQLDKGRKFPVGPKEKITLGQRPPGKYTLTIYNEKGEFVDNLTRNIAKEDKESFKFVLNEKTVSNSGKITGLTTGQKVAITAGAIGAAALGTALVNKALQGGGEESAQTEYIPPPVQELQQIPQQVAQNVPPIEAVQRVQDKFNAFLEGGKAFKFLNSLYDEVTLTVEDPNGVPIGNNWLIPRASALQKAQPLIYAGNKITIGPDQRILVNTPDGFQLQRYAFELTSDVLDGSYIWVLK